MWGDNSSELEIEFKNIYIYYELSFWYMHLQKENRIKTNCVLVTEKHAFWVKDTKSDRHIANY